MEYPAEQLSLEKAGEALEAFQKSIAYQENHADFHYRLGLLYLNQNNHEEAQIAFEKLLQLKNLFRRQPPAEFRDMRGKFQGKELRPNLPDRVPGMRIFCRTGFQWPILG